MICRSFNKVKSLINCYIVYIMRNPNNIRALYEKPVKTRFIFFPYSHLMILGSLWPLHSQFLRGSKNFGFPLKLSAQNKICQMDKFLKNLLEVVFLRPCSASRNFFYIIFLFVLIFRFF